MSYSYTISHSSSFTVTHARHMGAKVATDLKRMQRFYGKPSDSDIASYEAEITAFLKENLLKSVAYGFRRDNCWIEPTLQYTAHELMGAAANDDDPGRIRPGASVNGAEFHSFLIYSNEWDKLTDAEKAAFRETLPFTRTSGSEPSVNGYFAHDRTYSSGGRALNRSSVRSY